MSALQSHLARHQPSSRTADERIDALCRQQWRENAVLVVRLDDPRLAWPEREVVRQIGERVFGRSERV